MPNKIVVELVKRVEKIEHSLNEHLMQSGSIQTQLKFNTWLTGVILVSLLAQFVKSLFIK